MEKLLKTYCIPLFFLVGQRLSIEEKEEKIFLSPQISSSIKRSSPRGMPQGPSPKLDFSKKNLDNIDQVINEQLLLQHSQLQSSSQNQQSQSTVSPVASSTSSQQPQTVQQQAEERLKNAGAQTLFLQHNRLTGIPTKFSEHFVSLRVLYLNNNALMDMPVEICALIHLVKLHLENNQIKVVPPMIGQLVQLKKIYLHNNLLESLPDEMGKLTNLTVLHLQNNQLRTLNPHLSASTMLDELSIFGNPIEIPPPFVYNKGFVYLLRYMREIRESLLQETPLDEYIFTRKISFTENLAKNKLKRTASSKGLNRNSSMKIIEKESEKAATALKRKGSKILEREFVDDSIHLNQNHLLFFLCSHNITECAGRREYMEDKAIAITRLHQRKADHLFEEIVNLFSKVGYFGIFDGHGGVRCAEYLLQNLHKNICNQEAFARGEFEKALLTGFQQTDDNFLKLCREHYYMDGSTCAIALIIDNKVITAHAGDSRIVLCRDKKAVRLTEDHKPDRVDELARIEEAGGEVIFRGNCFRVAGDLAMSRSFGDLRLKEPLTLVISEPEIRVEELTPKDQFLILASDGLWDVLSDQKACDIVRRCENFEEASKRLVETAINLGTMDNTTAIVVKFNWSLDFLTDDELEGKVAISKSKTRSVTMKEVKMKSSPPSSPKRSSPLAIKERNAISEPNLEIENSMAFSSSPSSSPSSPSSHAISSSSPSSSSSIAKEITIEEDITEENLERTRRSSFSLRDNFEGWHYDGGTSDGDHPRNDSSLLGSKQPTGSGLLSNPKRIYLPTSSSAIKLKVLIPDIAATKLMKFDTTTKTKEIIQVLVQKHRFTGSVHNYVLYCKGSNGNLSQPMNLDSELSQLDIHDNDQVELRRNQEKPNELLLSDSLSPSDSQKSSATSSLSETENLTISGNPSSSTSTSTTSSSSSSSSSEELFLKGNKELKPNNEPSELPSSKRKEDLQTETILLRVLASAYKLENRSWISLDGGKSYLSITKNAEERFRILALTFSNEFVINAWILPNGVYKRMSDTFFNFHAVSSSCDVIYGLSFQTKENADQFEFNFLSCMEIIEEKAKGKADSANDTNSSGSSIVSNAETSVIDRT